MAIYRNWWCNPFGNNVGDQTKEQTDEDFAVCWKTLGKRSHDSVFEVANLVWLRETVSACMHLFLSYVFNCCSMHTLVLTMFFKVSMDWKTDLRSVSYLFRNIVNYSFQILWLQNLIIFRNTKKVLNVYLISEMWIKFTFGLLNLKIMFSFLVILRTCFSPFF